jgi:hypothetical protein
MPANYVLLAKNVVGAASASSVTFSNIPQTGYTDLLVKISARTNFAGAGDYIYMSLNGNTSLNSYTMILGDGSSAASYSGSGGTNATGISSANGATATANTFSNSEIYIPNYASSNAKSASNEGVTENNATAANSELRFYLNTGTSAITSITLTAGNGPNFVQHSTFYLYGVAKLGTEPAIVPYATGGDTIMTDGTYWYHAFKASGTFTPAKALSCDVLVVAGGGGSSGYYGGGGGAGGLRSATSQSLASGTGYTATIGAGGAGSGTGIAGAGSNSSFNSLSSSGGGQGNTWPNISGVGYPGGSGGGASLSFAAGGAGNSGSYSPVEGYAGGAGGKTGGNESTGGGGGATAVGGAAGNGTTGGNGGAGSSAFSSWGSVTGTGQNVSGTYWFAGGGGGGTRNASSSVGTGGNGGGGAGGLQAAGTSGTANTGGGGGGGTYEPNTGVPTGGSGGSGIVIVRYAV